MSLNIKWIALFVAILFISISGFSQSTEKITENGKEFFLHTVEQGDNLFTISKLYNVPVNKIAFANVLLLPGIEIGQKLKIPIAEIGNFEFFYHTVKSGESLYSISKLYNADIMEVTNKNPEIVQDLSSGMIVTIPNSSFVANVYKDIEIQEDTAKVAGDITSINEYIDKPCDKFSYNKNITFSIGLLLPFYAQENQKITLTENNGIERIGFYKNSEKFLELYQGILMAANDLRTLGISINLKVFDTENNTTKVEEILEAGKLNNVDLLIGPVYPSNVRIVTEFAKTHKINVVSPLSNNKSILSENPYYYEANTSMTARLQVVSTYLQQFQNSNIVFLHNGSEDEKDITRANIEIINKLRETNDSLTTPKEVNFQDGRTTALKNSFVKETENIVIIPSSDEVFITNVIMKLSVLADYYNITIFGNSAWERFQNIELEYNRLLNINYHTSSFIDYSKEPTISFVKSYRNFYNTEPSPYSFQGYDILLYFSRIMQRYGTTFQYCISESDQDISAESLQSKFNFERDSTENGFKNVGVFVLKFNDEFQLKPVDTKVFIPYKDRVKDRRNEKRRLRRSDQN